MILVWPDKAPADHSDFGMDWAAQMALASPPDTVVSASWAVPAGLVAGAQSQTPTRTTIWLAGGTAGQDYLVHCTISTAAGRVLRRTARLPVRSPVPA